MMTAEEIVRFLNLNPGMIVTGDASVSGVNFQKIPTSETAAAAALAASANPDDPAFLPRPLYLRAPDVTMKPLAPLIKPTAPEDAPLLAPLHAASFGAAAWNLEQIKGSLALPTTRGWVASQDGKPVGFILGQMTSQETEILTFAVHPESQRRGIGEKLLREFIHTSQKAETARIFLEVAADNHAAAKLYEKLGFRKSGTRTNYYQRGALTLDAVLYERILSEQ
jgi:ribosomal-protein-alanine N-acetyltransferase